MAEAGWLEIEGEFRAGQVHGQAQVKYVNGYVMYANFNQGQVEGVASVMQDNSYVVILVQNA